MEFWVLFCGALAKDLSLASHILWASVVLPVQWEREYLLPLAIESLTWDRALLTLCQAHPKDSLDDDCYYDFLNQYGAEGNVLLWLIKSIPLAWANSSLLKSAQSLDWIHTMIPT